MIGILLNDNAYEQDIRELLMAFYPGETFVRENAPEVSFYIRGTADMVNDTYTIALSEEGKEASESIPMGSSRIETKNRIKRMLYGLLKNKTGRDLPWGTLTGIRPTKIAMTKLDAGISQEDVCRYMKETYLTSDEKTALSIEIAQRERSLLSAVDYKDGYSLYIGIPFCPTTCLYCSFTSFPIGKWEGRTHLYLEALLKEMEYTANKMKGRTLNSVYFGGGTPTSLPAEDIDAILTRLKSLFDLAQIQEFTVEAGRPDSITREKLEILRSHGITRISINPQSMKQKTLDLIGRHHTVEMIKDCFTMARDMGFDNINMDLIIGLPGETIEDVQQTMEEVKALFPDSITVHSLAIKRAARLNMFKEQYADLKIMNTQEIIDLTARYARDMGMEPYYLYRQKNMAGNFENVGYALPGKACIYNILIMEEKQTIAACGAGTTTKVTFPLENRLERVENVKDVEQYIERIDEMLERKNKILN